MSRQFGLIGKVLTHSFSQKYFGQKFEELGIRDEYSLFELNEIEEIEELLKRNPNLKGLNVTIPYKHAIFNYLDEIHPVADKLSAVNTIHIKNGKWIGFNTDIIGFQKSLEKFLPDGFSGPALILGTGASSRTIFHVLRNVLNFSVVQKAGRNNHPGADFDYTELTPDIIASFPLLVNTTPLGTYPDINDSPDIPYSGIGPNHFMFDLVYNPPETQFLKKGKELGARTKNGYEMLVLQAEAAWEIWNS